MNIKISVTQSGKIRGILSIFKLIFAITILIGAILFLTQIIREGLPKPYLYPCLFLFGGSLGYKLVKSIDKELKKEIKKALKTQP